MGSEASLTGAGAIRDALTELMEADEAVVVLGDSVGRDGGVAGSTEGLLQRFGAERVVDLPVADRAALAYAVGLALGGRKPIVELTSTGRLAAVVEVLAEAGAMNGGEFSVPLVLRVPYGTEAKGLDRAIGDLLPSGVTVVCAAGPAEAAGLLRSAVAAGRPTVVLEPRAVYADRARVGAEALPSRARIVREGDHVTLAAWGVGVDAARSAADELAGEGISAEVVDLVALSPLDRDTLGASVRKTGRLVVVHPADPALADHVRRVGLDEGFLYLESPLSDAADRAAEVVRAARSSVGY